MAACTFRTPLAARVLIVDSRRETREVARSVLTSAGLVCQDVADGNSAWTKFRSARPNLILSALCVDGLSGLELLRRVRRLTATPFIVQTGIAELGAAVQALREGADDLIQLPYRSDEFPARVLGALKLQESRDPLVERIVGSSREIVGVRERLVAVARFRVPALIFGEPGTGRRLVAQALTDLDNNGALMVLRPGQPIEPMRQLVGKNIYLKSIESHTEAAHEFWRNVLEERAAGLDATPYRVLASSGADLARAAQAGSFNRGLAGLLGRFTLRLPPLRERRKDIGELVRAISKEVSRKLGGPGAARFTAPALAALQAHAWPGNVSQLARVVERLVVFSRLETIAKASVASVLGDMGEGVSGHRRSHEYHLREELVREIEATGGNLAEVGRRMGVSRGAIIYRAQKFGLMPQRARRRSSHAEDSSGSR